MKTKRAEPRSAALEILKRTRQGQPFDATLTVAMRDLSARDSGLAHEIAAGVLRHRRVIDKEIQHRLTHPETKLADRIHDIIRIGVFQLIYLNKIPSYAAVSSAVDLARDVGGKKTAGLVNAVLRNVDRSGRAIDLTQCSVAERHSHPDWLVNRWHDTYGPAGTERLLDFFNTRPSLVVQSARWDEDMLVRAFRAADVQFTASPTQHGIVIDTGDVSGLPGYKEGAFIVQDPAQRALLEFAAIPQNVNIWDACAAPGGKAVTMAAGRTVIATEVSPRRTRTLIENKERVAPRLHVVIADAIRFPFRDHHFDVVVVDAPCSGTGSMARHPDARWSLTPERIRKAVEMQRGILDATANAVKPGGLLIYLTCSLESEENERQVDRFLELHSEFERTREDLSIFPPDQRTDGGYGARMRRAI